MKKRLIAIDGLDASGKMTQTEMLKDKLASLGLSYRYLSFPTYDVDYSAHVNMYLKGRFGDDPEIVNPFAASSFSVRTGIAPLCLIGRRITKTEA